MRIGFVGTGTMGTPIAGCLIRAGHTLTVYDRCAEATETLCGQGAARAESGFAAARDSEAVFTSLPGQAEFEAAIPGRPAPGAPSRSKAGSRPPIAPKSPPPTIPPPN